MSSRHRCFEYVPDAGQQLEFHAARGIYRFRAAICGTGAGKTICGLAESISWAKLYPGSIGWIFEPSFPMVRNILIPTLEKAWLLGFPMESNPEITAFNKSAMRVQWRNGSQFWFGSLEDPERAEGPNIDYAMIDEARLVRKLAVALRVIRRRLRGSGASRDYPIGLWITTTADAPRSELHNFVENPLTRHPELKLFRWSIYDNPHLTKEYIKDQERGHHGGLAERFLWGKFAAVGVGTIPFDYATHVITTAEFNKAVIRQIVYAVDFGWTNPSCILVIGFDRDGRAYVLDEFYMAQVTEDRVLEEGKEFIRKYGYGRFYCDPTESQTIKWLCSHGLDAVKSEPKRKEGIRHMASYFPKAGDAKPRIYILSHCVNLIAELQVYNEERKEYDHAVDPLRYGLGSKFIKETDEVAAIFG